MQTQQARRPPRPDRDGGGHPRRDLRERRPPATASSSSPRETPPFTRGRDAKRIAKHLVRLGIEPELVLCSSAERTRETLVRPILGASSTVRLEAKLYAASSHELLERIRAVPDGVTSVMLIGHNPGLQD